MMQQKINRRDFLKFAFPVVILGGATVKTFSPHRRYGHIMASDVIARKMTALFNGADVTDYCNAAHDGEGWVDLLPVDETGRVVGMNPRRFYGDVVLRLKP